MKQSSNITRWILAGVLAMSLTAGVQAAPRRVPGTGPITISTTVNGTKATVTVKFGAALNGAEVDVWGVSGLTVAGDATLLTNASVAAGDTRTFQVSVVPGAGASYLGVRASGMANGQRVIRVSRAAFGTAEHAATVQRNGETVILRSAGTPRSGH